jgi:hypothetical protein
VDIHLVGSIGLDTVDEVFATVGKLLGPHLRRIPDGEVGGRRQWKDATQRVDFANTLAKSIQHKLAYIHMPIPVERSDDAFHRPLRDLNLTDGTALFLGVVHAKDGVEGTRARIAAARRHAPEFGIATECGMARARSAETVRTLLKIHAEVCAGG